jgi:hypothetical protein
MMKMAGKITMHTKVTRYKFVRLLLVSVLLISGIQMALPVHSSETGIKGTVFWGPVKPGPAAPGQSDEAPLSGSFMAVDSKQKVTRFRSDKQGSFEVCLPAGKYIIVPDNSKPALFPGKQEKFVTVPENGFAEITLRYDSGMR